jgi:hypothetical protein
MAAAAQQQQQQQQQEGGRHNTDFRAFATDLLEQQLQQQAEHLPVSAALDDSAFLEFLNTELLTTDIEDLLQQQPLQQEQQHQQQSAPWCQQPMQQRQQQAPVYQLPVHEKEQQQAQHLRGLDDIFMASLGGYQQQQQQQRPQHAHVHQQPVQQQPVQQQQQQQRQQQAHVQQQPCQQQQRQPQGVQGLRGLDDSFFASLTARPSMATSDATSQLQQLLHEQQLQQQQQQQVQFQVSGTKGSRQGSTTKRGPRRKAGAVAAAAAAADAAGAADAGAVDCAVGAEAAPSSTQHGRSRKSGGASKSSSSVQRRVQRASQRASQRSAADVPASEGTAGPTNTAAGAAAADADAAASDGGAGADDTGGERSDSGKAPSRTIRKGASQAALEEDYSQRQYYSKYKDLNDANRKKFAVVSEHLCQMAHRDTYCSHNVLKNARHVQIRHHDANFALICMSASGVLRCLMSPAWAGNADVQEQWEGVLQATRQHWYDAEAGDDDIEPSLYELEEHLPPTLGLHDFGTRVGQWALKHAVYNIRQLWLADWLHGEGEQAV